MLDEREFGVSEEAVKQEAEPTPATAADWSVSQKKEKPKKEKGEKKNGLVRSAANGIVFGLCAAAVICVVLLIGKKTFLKPAESKEPGAQVWIENTETADSEQPEKEAATDTAPTQTNKNQKDAQTLSVEEIAKNCMPSVVSITTVGVEEVRSLFGTQKYKSTGAGSGIIIGQNDTELLIATNNHVVSSAEEVSVCFKDGDADSAVSAAVKGTDPSNDLAIVSVIKEDIPEQYQKNIKIATIGSSDDLCIGEQVVAIGNALGYGQSVTTGIVSALDRKVEFENFSAKLIQTDAAINPGNSGGALLNMKGELVGINSAKFASEEVEGMGYAIPIATAQPILDSLMNREYRELASEEEAGFLGITVQDVSDEAADAYDIPKGAYVASVEEGCAADKAGIQKGDIITKFDGLVITDRQSLVKNIAYYKSGETVEVVLMRSNNGIYEEKTVSVTLAKSKAIEEQRKAQQEVQDDDKEDGGADETAPDEQNPNGDREGSFEDFFDNDMFRDFFEQFSNGEMQGQSQKRSNRGL